MKFLRELSRLIVGSLLLLTVSINAQSLVGKRQFITHCSVCHGEDGHGGQMGPNIVDIKNPRATSIEAVHNIVRSGIPTVGMPAFTRLSDADVEAIARYVMSFKASAAPALSVQPAAIHGDPNAGFEFFVHQGKCASCHSIQGRGGVVGPDLGDIGSMRSTMELLQELKDSGLVNLHRYRQQSDRRW